MLDGIKKFVGGFLLDMVEQEAKRREASKPKDPETQEERRKFNAWKRQQRKEAQRNKKKLERLENRQDAFERLDDEIAKRVKAAQPAVLTKQLPEVSSIRPASNTNVELAKPVDKTRDGPAEPNKDRPGMDAPLIGYERIGGVTGTDPMPIRFIEVDEDLEMTIANGIATITYEEPTPPTPSTVAVTYCESGTPVTRNFVYIP